MGERAEIIHNLEHEPCELIYKEILDDWLVLIIGLDQRIRDTQVVDWWRFNVYRKNSAGEST